MSKTEPSIKAATGTVEPIPAPAALKEAAPLLKAIRLKLSSQAGPDGDSTTYQARHGCIIEAKEHGYFLVKTKTKTFLFSPSSIHFVEYA